MKRLRINSGQVALTLAVLLLIFLVVYPLAQLVFQSFQFNQSWSLQNYYTAITTESNLLALRHSLEISLTAMLGATVLGAFLAWLVARTDLPGRGALRTALFK